VRAVRRWGGVLVIGTRTRVPREGQRGHDALRRTGTFFVSFPFASVTVTPSSPE
jgi:hypothetical protein